MISLPFHMQYASAAKAIEKFGSIQTPRGITTKEMCWYGFQSTPGSRFLVIPGRKLNYAFAIAEAMSFLIALNSVDYLEPYNSNLKQFSDDGHTYHGHYGVRMRRARGDSSDFHSTHDQFAEVVQVLSADPSSRRAVISIWDPQIDQAQYQSKDYPCNTQLIFMIREGKLHLTVVRRSSDLIWGLPYDHLVFSLIRDVIAAELNVVPGVLVEFANSLHYYLNFNEVYGNQLDAVLYAAQANISSFDDGHPMLGVKATETLITDWLELERLYFRERPDSPPVALEKLEALLTDLSTIDGWWAQAVALQMGFWLNKTKRFDELRQLFLRVNPTWAPLWKESYKLG